MEQFIKKPGSEQAQKIVDIREKAMNSIPAALHHSIPDHRKIPGK